MAPKHEKVKERRRRQTLHGIPVMVVVDQGEGVAHHLVELTSAKQTQPLSAEPSPVIANCASKEIYRLLEIIHNKHVEISSI
jgi:hypothetical protein